MSVKEDPDVVIAAEPELLATIGDDLHGDLHMGSKVKVMLGVSVVIFGEVDIIKWKSAFAAILVSVVVGAVEGDGAVVLLGELFAIGIVSFVEPTIKIISWLNWVVPDYVGGESIMISSPGIFVVSISRYGQTVGAELTFDNVRNDAFGIETAFRPFKLAVWVFTIVHALIPVGDGHSDGFGVA